MLPSCRDVMLCSASNMSCSVSVEHSRASLVPTLLSDDLEIEKKVVAAKLETSNYAHCTIMLAKNKQVVPSFVASLP